MKIKLLLISVMASSLFAGGSCTQWYKEMRVKYHMIGIKTGIIMDNDGTWKKIFSKGTASVDFSDEEEREDALEEAQMKAKASMVHFLKEKLSSEKSLEEISKKLKDLQKIDKNTQKVSISKKSIKTKINKIQNSASSLLKGIVVLCESIEDNRAEVVVAVSPKTQRAADTARKSMYKSSSKTNKSTSYGYVEKTTQKNYVDTSDNLDF